MKKLIALVLVFSSFCGLSQSLLDTTMMKALKPEGYREPGVAFKRFNLISIDGKLYTHDRLKNKVTFINFWYEACVPCIAEFDALNDQYRKYSKYGDFRFLSLTFETPEIAIRVAKKYDLTYPIICVGRKEIYDLIFQLGFPTSIVTDRNGIIRFIKCGGPAEAEKAREIVDTIYVNEIERLLHVK